MALNARQRLFVQEYLKDKNATRAAARAGYSKKTVYSAGPRLLENVGVKKALEAALGKLETKLEITAERNLRRIAEIAYEDELAKRADILKACELIGKTFGQFKDVTENRNTNVNAGDLPPEVAKKIYEKIKNDC